MDALKVGLGLFQRFFTMEINNYVPIDKPSYMRSAEEKDKHNTLGEGEECFSPKITPPRIHSIFTS
jgi:hypothetical protein